MGKKIGIRNIPAHLADIASIGIGLRTHQLYSLSWHRGRHTITALQQVLPKGIQRIGTWETASHANNRHRFILTNDGGQA